MGLIHFSFILNFNQSEQAEWRERWDDTADLDRGTARNTTPGGCGAAKLNTERHGIPKREKGFDWVMGSSFFFLILLFTSFLYINNLILN